MPAPSPRPLPTSYQVEVAQPAVSDIWANTPKSSARKLNGSRQSKPEFEYLSGTTNTQRNHKVWEAAGF